MVAWQVLLITGMLAAPGETTLVNFSGPNCPHCQKMEPVLAQMQQAGVQVQTVNVEAQPDVARQFKVQAIPTLVLMVDGREANRVVGSTSFEKLVALMPSQKNSDDIVRGQSPAIPSAAAPRANYLSERLNGLFGKGSPTNQDATPSKDPFADRLAVPEITSTPPARNAIPKNVAVRGQSPDASFPQRALAAAVRLKVEDDRGFSVGSGTIIDQNSGEALVITCGHIFRESKGQGKIMVDLFQPRPRSVEGRLVGFDNLRDIGLVSIRVDGPITAVPVAPANFTLQKNSPVFSIGCDHGNQPEVRNSKVNSLQRYKGPPNVEVAGAPVDGRSGGGLFSPEGYLVGVCNAADPQDDEGIYAALPTVHWQLDKVGLQTVYQRPAAATPLAESFAETEAAPQTFPISNRDPLPEMPERRQPAANPVALASYEAPVGNEAHDMEIICIVRSRSNPAKKNQIYVLDKVSNELMQHISQASYDPTTRADLSLQADRRSAAGYPESRGTIVRGQSLER